MAFTQYQNVLAFLMVVTGSINTLSTKWADHLTAAGKDGISRKFDHPFVQACTMFMGEILCLIAFKALFYYYTKKQVVIEDVDIIRGSQNFSPWLFLPAAMCDMIATSLMYIGLELTYASSFQMLRGSVIVFVALLSTSFVGREINRRQWTGIVFIIEGLVLVGIADFSNDSSRDFNSIITGDLLIVMAQIITACQMVYEEKFVVDKDIPPLQVVGWEGTFGFVILGTLLIPFYYIKVGSPFSNNSNGSLEDLPDALVQMSNNFWIIVSSVGTMISIAFFNFAGISITKESSATTRMVLDTVRTFFIWIFSLLVGWQNFHWMQLAGFGVLSTGMAVYYNVLPDVALFGIRRHSRQADAEPIVNQAADEP